VVPWSAGLVDAVDHERDVIASNPVTDPLVHDGDIAIENPKVRKDRPNMAEKILRGPITGVQALFVERFIMSARHARPPSHKAFQPTAAAETRP